MRQKMSEGSRRELLARVRPRYREATWSEKKRILTEFVALTGYHRKYAVQILNMPDQATPGSGDRRGGRRRYTDDVKAALITVWRAANCICSKRLIPFLAQLVLSMERHGHLSLSPSVRDLLLSMSPATMDRLLAADRRAHRQGLGTTKSVLLLKRLVPVRTFADWADVEPGMFEADLVAHCGNRIGGEFTYTLVVTDVATGWTECRALVRRSEDEVIRALNQVRALLPFPMRGLDTDNGSEFLNYAVLDWCKGHTIEWTRSRPYRKNDQAHVEEKNGSIVRRLVGYDRYEGKLACAQLDRMYAVVRLYINYFQPCLKLISRERRDNGHVHKEYDLAQTPYQRLLSSAYGKKHAARLGSEYLDLDPVALRDAVALLRAELSLYARTSQEADAAAYQGQGDEKVLPLQAGHAGTMDSNQVTAWRFSGASSRRDSRPLLSEIWKEVARRLGEDPTLRTDDLYQELCERHPRFATVRYQRALHRKVEALRALGPQPPDSAVRSAASSDDHAGEAPDRRRGGHHGAFAAVWPELCRRLEADPSLRATDMLVELGERHPGRYTESNLRTLMRLFRRWREDHGAPPSRRRRQESETERGA
jgi:hypothetical protein